MANKSSLDNILKAVLSVNGQERSMFYSPKIYTDQRNVVESLLLSALVKSYPSSQDVIDQIAPFVEVETIPMKDGHIELPEQYRNLLGSPMVFAKPDSSGECNEQEPVTTQTFKVGVLKSGCLLNPVIIVPQSEFAYKTQSTYDKPTWERPIGTFVSKKRIKLCPYDITRVSLMYARKEKEVRYGYISQPDETYLYDEATSVETEFDSNAFTPIFNAICALYSAYAKNQEMQNWAVLLSEKGIL